MLDIGTRFSDKSKDYFLKNPMMSEKRRQPVEKVALDAHRTVVEKNQQTVMKDIFTRSGLFFFQSTCEFCHEESQILQFMQNYYWYDILPVSMDGRPFPKWVVPGFLCP
ncbi:conjugal transfer protein TraF [Enterobacter cloacae complex sp. 288G10]|uniref:conjugal transfer protein TraF n=1 Tax=Enterobacter cloacae complex sp. 288G10 TaxID=3395859 RepID=UPI003CEABEDA